MSNTFDFIDWLAVVGLLVIYGASLYELVTKKKIAWFQVAILVGMTLEILPSLLEKKGFIVPFYNDTTRLIGPYLALYGWWHFYKDAKAKKKLTS